MNGKPPQVAIGLYSGRTVDAAMPVNVLGMAWELAQRGMWYHDPRLWHESCRVDSNRNYLIHDFLHQTAADFLFIVDADMQHPPLAPIVLAERDKPIVCGLYFHRRRDGMYAPHFYRHRGENADPRRGHGTDVNWYYEPMTAEVCNYFAGLEGTPYHNEPVVLTKPGGSWATQSLMRIDASGFGCVMLRRDALEQLEAAGGPFLRDEPGLNGDLAFYKKCEQLGIDVWGDASVICSHASSDYIGLASFHDYVTRSQAQQEKYTSAIPTITGAARYA